jgi:hypothetical protein
MAATSAAMTTGVLLVVTTGLAKPHSCGTEAGHMTWTVTLRIHRSLAVK